MSPSIAGGQSDTSSTSLLTPKLCHKFHTREFVEPKGWKSFLLDKADPTTSEEEESTSLTPPQPPIHVNLLQICVLANHLNGKDTHVRGIKVFSPSLPTVLSTEDQINSQIGLNSLADSRGSKSRDYRVRILHTHQKEKEKPGSSLNRMFHRSKNEDAARKKALKSFGMEAVTKERDLVIKREDGTQAVRTSDSGLESIESDFDRGNETRDEDDADGGEQKTSLPNEAIDDDFKKFARLLPELSKGFGSAGGFGLR